MQDFLAGPSNDESVPNFLLDCTKVHAWADGSEIRGKQGLGSAFHTQSTKT